MAVVLGLLVALCYGAGDFLGGVATRAQPVATVVLVSQGTGRGLVTVILVLDGTGPPAGGDLALGVLSGLIGVVGVALLYQGLAAGSMGVVAPVTAVGAALVPLVAGLVIGERPSVLALIGAAGALIAIVLVARTPGRHEGSAAKHELVLALGAGTAFGFVFVVLGATDEASGFWPLLGARAASVTLLLVWVVRSGLPLVPRRDTRATVMGAGVLDVGANALYLLAVRDGLLSLVSVLSSLYPLTTVLLARVVLGERLHRSQVIGLGLGLGGVALIATA
ncbi:EamA family transporter [soil metagenome]